MKKILILVLTINSLVVHSQLTWVKKSNFPVGLYYHIAFTIEDTAYVGLGTADWEALEYNYSVYKYDSENDLWNELSPYPGNNCYGATAFVINNVAYVCFGVNESHQWVKDVWKYEKENDQWMKMIYFP